jgi:hypothetical protein
MFFVSVYVFGVLVCLNIVIAFALDSYSAVIEARENDENENDGNDGATPGALLDERSARDSIDDTALKFRPSIPVALQKSASLKRTVRNITRRGARPPTTNHSSESLPSVGHELCRAKSSCESLCSGGGSNKSLCPETSGDVSNQTGSSESHRRGSVPTPSSHKCCLVEVSDQRPLSMDI